MNRIQLDQMAVEHRLPTAAVSAALGLSGARPDASSWRDFAVRLLRGAGLGAVGAGTLFFVAANWQDYGVLGRFVLLQAALLACVGVALWRPPPQPAGQGALLLATLLAGGLLALFGQSYQTGADVYELVLTWAALTLPFALAGSSGALWAVWWVVLNVGLALLCGALGPDHVVWRVLDGRHLGREATLLLPCAINLLAALSFGRLQQTRCRDAAPDWLIRMLAALGVAYGTAAAFIDLTSYDPAIPVVVLHIVVCGVIAFLTCQRRGDVFLLALVAASLIALATTGIVKDLRLNNAGSFLLIALWLIGSSTGAAFLLMRLQRAWRHQPPGDVPAEAAPTTTPSKPGASA